LRRSAWLWLGLFSWGTFFLTGCGGGGTTNTAQFRLVQASPDAPSVSVLIDGKSVSDTLAYGNATAYLSVKSGSRHVQVVPVSASSPIFDQNISLSSSTKTDPVAHRFFSQHSATYLDRWRNYCHGGRRVRARCQRFGNYGSS